MPNIIIRIGKKEKQAFQKALRKASRQAGRTITQTEVVENAIVEFVGSVQVGLGSGDDGNTA